ncbi:hypothetical protein D3C78_1446400 [compost metagenome]
MPKNCSITGVEVDQAIKLLSTLEARQVVQEHLNHQLRNLWTGDMGSDHDVFRVPELVGLGKRLFAEDVQYCAGKLTGLHGYDQVVINH